jgi:hypothetical protein
MTNLEGVDDLIRAGSTERCGGYDRGRRQVNFQDVFASFSCMILLRVSYDRSSVSLRWLM